MKCESKFSPFTEKQMVSILPISRNEKWLNFSLLLFYTLCQHISSNKKRPSGVPCFGIITWWKLMEHILSKNP